MTKLFFWICFILIQSFSSFSYALRCEDLFVKGPLTAKPTPQSKAYDEFVALLTKAVDADQSLTRENLILFIKDVSQKKFSQEKISDTELVQLWEQIKTINLASMGPYYVKRFSQTASEMARETLEGAQTWYNYSVSALWQGSAHKILRSSKLTESYFPFKPIRASTSEVNILFEYILQYQVLQRIESNPDLFIQLFNAKSTEASSYLSVLKSIRLAFFYSLDKPAPLQKPVAKKETPEKETPDSSRKPTLQSKDYDEFVTLLTKAVDADQSMTREKLIEFIKDVSQKNFSQEKFSDTELVQLWDQIKTINLASMSPYYVKRFSQTVSEMVRKTLEGERDWYSYSVMTLAQGSVEKIVRTSRSTEAYFPFKQIRASTSEVNILFEYILQYQLLQRIESNPDSFIQLFNAKSTEASNYLSVLKSIRNGFFFYVDRPSIPEIRRPDRSRPRLGQVQGADTPIRKQCGGTCYLEAVIETVDRELQSSGNIQYRLNRPQLFARWLIQRISTLNLNAPNLSAQISEMMRAGSVIQFIDFLSSNLKLSAGVTTAEAMKQEDAFISRFTEEIKGLAKAHDNNNSGSSGLILLSGTQSSSNSDFQSSLKRYVDWLKIEVAKVSPTLSGFNNKVIFKKVDLSKGIAEKPAFHSSVEAEIKNRLHHVRGVMVRFHMLSSLQTIKDNRAGFYDVPGNKPDVASLKALAKDDSLHFGAVVDYVTGADGNIEYLVVKNSWGSESSVTDNGYIYLSVRYLALFGREIYFSEISP